MFGCYFYVLDFGIETKDVDMVDLLMELGAKLDTKNKDLGSVVAQSSQDNNVDMVKYLLKKELKFHIKQDNSWLYGILTDRLADPIYNTTKINRNTDFRIVKVWGNYGKPLDDNILTE